MTDPTIRDLMDARHDAEFVIQVAEFNTERLLAKALITAIDATLAQRGVQDVGAVGDLAVSGSAGLDTSVLVAGELGRAGSTPSSPEQPPTTIFCRTCGDPALVIHEAGRCGYSVCAMHANARHFCLGCGANWMEVSPV